MKSEKIIGLLLVACAMMAQAMPAYRGPIVRTLPDGTQEVVYMQGERRMDERLLMANGRKMPAQTEGIGDEPNPAPRGLLLLVQFQDVQFTTPKDTIDSMLNGAHFTRDYHYEYEYEGKVYPYDIHAEGSARQYFHDQSYGAYNPQFDVFGPVTLSKNASYYGQDYTDEQGNVSHDINILDFVQEACQLADEAGANFALYDNDNNGVVDFVYFIYAGYGQADGGGDSTIWPHQWNVSYYHYIHDLKTIGRYACGCELNFISKVYAGIGTFCHEFSHVLGLPDLYETNYNRTGVHTLFNWDIMDYGSYNNDGNTPPAYSAYERFYMGWLTPRMLKEPENVLLFPINEGQGESLLISTANTHNMSGWDPNPKEYYLLEARRREGWDAYLPGSGMMITKVSYNSSTWKSNTVNNNARAMGVDILEAITNTTDHGMESDLYPVNRAVSAWKGYADHEVTEITRKGEGKIGFKYRGGTEDIESIQSSDVSIQKILRNGQIYLMYNGQMYNVLGGKIGKW